jgi:RHS repeat-associated protein
MSTGCSPTQGINDGKGLGDCCDIPGSRSAGNPITIGTGNKFEAVTDYATAGQNPLAFIRYYNGFSQWHAPTATLGSNWRSNYDRYLTILTNPSGAVAERADGQVVEFNVRNGVGTPDSDVDLALVQLAHFGEWTLTDRDDNVETYGPPDSTTGRSQLLTIQSRNGYTQTLSYNSSNQLVAVTDSYNRTLSLTYANGLLSTVTTPDGLVLTYGYNSSGITPGTLDRLASVNYSTSPATSQTYLYENSALPFALTGIIDEDGNRFATWAYDQYGRATSSQHAGGADLTTLSYDINSNGNPTSTTTTNALGQQAVYNLSVLQTVAKVIGIDRLATSTTAAATESFTYDTNGYVASQTDWNGNLTNYVNDSRGEPTSITEAVGTPQQRVTTMTYLSNYHLPSQIVGPLTTTNFTYDGSGGLLTRAITDTTTFTVPYPTNGITRTWTYTWANFLLASAHGPRGAGAELMQYGYDASGALTSVTNALGQVTQITAHLPGGLPETIVDPNGIVTDLTYDPRNRLLSSTLQNAVPLTTSYTYDAAGNLLTTTLPDGSALTDGYDQAHRLVSVADLINEQVLYTLNAFGDRTQIQIAVESTHTVQIAQSASFDALGRVLQSIGGAGQTTSYTYDDNANVLTITDPRGYVTTQIFDPLNRKTQMTQPNAGTTTLQYNPTDHLNAVTDPNGNKTSYVNDGFGDRIQEVSPDRGTTVYTYNIGGLLTQKVDAAGVVTNQNWDFLDRISTTSYPGNPAENVAYTYDQGTNGIGRLTGVADAAGTLSLVYNSRGLVTGETRTVGQAVLATTYNYDRANRPLIIAYPSGLDVTYTRDNMGRVISVAAAYAHTHLSASVLSAITYLPFGPPTGMTYGDGASETRSYDLGYRETDLAAAWGSPLQNLSYAYDPNDNVLSIADGVTPANNQSFGYDNINRLTAASGSYGGLGYGYDLVGNRTSQTTTIGQAVTTQTYSYAAGSNRLAQIATPGTSTQQFSYDARGNLVQQINGSTTNTLAYNNANRLASFATQAHTVGTYVYNAFGQRLTKSASGDQTLYQYDRFGHLIEEDDTTAGPATPRADYIYLGDQPVGLFFPASGLLYYHDDRLGTPQLVTDTPQGIDWIGTYQPFGPLTINASITQNIRLPGQYADAETGWSNNGFRTYAQGLGRYIQADPIGLAGGLNLYAYALGNPIAHTDARGKESALDDLVVQMFCAVNPIACAYITLTEPGARQCVSSRELGRCLDACAAKDASGGQTWVNFCNSLSSPAARARCWSHQFDSETACRGYCFYEFGD